MTKLIIASIFTIRKRVILWIALSVSFVNGVVFSAISGMQHGFDGYFAIPLLFAMVIYVSISSIQNFSNGTIRNRIIVGYKKATILLADCVVNAMICCIMMLLFLLPCIMLCQNLVSEIPLIVIIAVIAGLLLMSISCAVSFTVICYLLNSTAGASVVCVILMLVSVLSAHFTETALYITNLNSQMVLSENGEYELITTIGNPDYVSGVKRTVYTFIDRFSFFGQLNEYSIFLRVSQNNAGIEPADLSLLTKELYATLSNPPMEHPIYSSITILAFLCVGLVLFSKKDLK